MGLPRRKRCKFCRGTYYWAVRDDGEHYVPVVPESVDFARAKYLQGTLLYDAWNHQPHWDVCEGRGYDDKKHADPNPPAPSPPTPSPPPPPRPKPPPAPQPPSGFYDRRGPSRSAALEMLHLLPSAPPEVVRAAYVALSLLHHPDRGGDIEKQRMVNVAWEALKP